MTVLEGSKTRMPTDAKALLPPREYEDKQRVVELIPFQWCFSGNYQPTTNFTTLSSLSYIMCKISAFID
ncbi:hypothetical protein [Hymenobacter guriensis]|uniref:Uncharacterized protein n=1 Tax=Hymenobacter guriensis TaxID=2793065 RepID=A0ABS0L4B8_9BACT|nr:hypothetical protein [Hymenobacter guriensis]MBG8554937.1 hypothetical protein [Hymenobacter guriensis]